MERFETGLVEPRDFVARCPARSICASDYDEFCEIWSCIFTETTDSGEHAGRLCARATGWCCFPTPTRMHFDMLRDDYPTCCGTFDDLMLSYEVRRMKPRPEIYRRRSRRRSAGPRSASTPTTSRLCRRGAAAWGSTRCSLNRAEQIEAGDARARNRLGIKKDRASAGEDARQEHP